MVIVVATCDNVRIKCEHGILPSAVAYDFERDRWYSTQDVLEYRRLISTCTVACTVLLYMQL